MKLIRIILFFYSNLAAFAIANGQQPRKVLNFNTNWAFHCGEVIEGGAVNYPDKEWTAVAIRHTMRLEKKYKEDPVFMNAGSSLPATRVM